MRFSVLLAVLIIAAMLSGGAVTLAPRGHAAPAPEVEYLYDVTVRRQYSFATPADAVNYGYGICDKVSRSTSYAKVMSDAKSDVRPNDEFCSELPGIERS